MIVGMSLDPETLLGSPAVEAGVAALAERNRHHYEAMDAQEREEAVAQWRELSLTVLSAARSTIGGPDSAPATEGAIPGRAIIVLEDAGGDDVSVHAAFHPELQELGDGQVAGSPSQITALSLLDALSNDAQEQPGA